MLTMLTVECKSASAVVGRLWRSMMGALFALTVSASMAAETLPMKELAPGVFVFNGVTAEQDAHNRGAISNLGFIVGSRCVAVIDTGGSPAVGAALRETVRQKTALP
ncbi:hypothetical protein NK983_25760, partial [Salmonella enterica subsp. enterica serovar Typhimurium]|nr:hypothetical protein [Salmonella enterica subsp. enterica serovar Typhimurium]